MKLIQGDSLEILKTLDDNSVDGLITDPPAGISFMNSDWDSHKGGMVEWVNWLAEIMKECLRVMKPGAHGLVWSLPRTSHWTGLALELAGFEIRDKVNHLFGNGMPKSHDISKALDKHFGCEREVTGTRRVQDITGGGYCSKKPSTTIEKKDNPVHPLAIEYDGYGTGLKPSHEDWWLIRKPIQGTIANNVLTFGTGGLNIDGCRIATSEIKEKNSIYKSKSTFRNCTGTKRHTGNGTSNVNGRWPSNTMFSHSEGCEDNCQDGCPVKELEEQSGWLKTGSGKKNSGSKKR